MSERSSEAPSGSWLQSPEHRTWLTQQGLALLRFFRSTLTPEASFVELDDQGCPLPTGCPPAASPRQNLLTVTRAVHCFSGAEILGVPGARPLVEQGLRTLWNEHRDQGVGGYFAAVGRRGGTGDTTKMAYAHAHVVLAASAALAAGHDLAEELLGDALAAIDERFWSEQDGAASHEDYDRAWNELEAYRGVNSNMHLCESLLAAAGVTGRSDLAQRALRIVTRFVDRDARAHDWLVPEHYDLQWQPMLDHNRDRPDDPFRPYGATIGHSLEWSRLVLGAGLATGELSERLLEMSEALFHRGVQAGWDEHWGGLYYTVDWDGTPVTRDRYWWPVAEGIQTSSYLLRLTGKPIYEEWYRRFWEFADRYFIDHERGGWYAIRDDTGARKNHPWFGKPDLYHCLQACLLPLLPVAPSFIGAVSQPR